MFFVTLQRELSVLSSPPTHFKRMLVWWMCAWDFFSQQKLIQIYLSTCLDLQQMVLQLVSKKHRIVRICIIVYKIMMEQRRVRICIVSLTSKIMSLNLILQNEFIIATRKTSKRLRTRMVYHRFYHRNGILHCCMHVKKTAVLVP